MKTPLTYLTLTKLKNIIKGILKSPSKLIYAIVMIAFLIFVIIANSRGLQNIYMLRDINELFAIILVFYAATFMVVSWGSFDKGSTVFKMPDVNFLFPAPIKSQSVLFYGMLQQLGSVLLMGLFVLYQYGWLSNVYGISFSGLMMILLGYVLTVFISQLLAMLVYSFLSANPRKKPLIKAVFILVPAVYVVYALYTVLPQSDNAISVAAELASTLPYRLFPVGGWISGIVRGFLIGSFNAAIPSLILTLVFTAGLVVTILLYNPDYYEDVLEITESRHNRLQLTKDGKKADIKSKRVRVKSYGIGKGQGASTFYYKQRLQSRRSGVFGIGTYELIFAGVAIVYTYITRRNGLIATLIFTSYLLLFTPVRSSFSQELRMPYLFLAPEPPFKKLLWVLAPSVPGFIAEAIIVFIPVGIILGLEVPEIGALVFFRFSMSLLFTAANLGVLVTFDTAEKRLISMLLYMLVILLLLIPGFIMTGFLTMTGRILYSSELTICLSMALCNIPTALVFTWFCRNILNDAEIN